jgi:uncharacterized protein YndB with AHSA1/START domain
MASNDYRFFTHWRVRARAEEVYELISKPMDFPRWWPEVYLKVEEVAPGDERGVGHCVRLHTRGWLPYTLNWQSCCTEADRPLRLAIRASGDFDGRGIWTLRQDGEYVDVTFDWQLRADKPLAALFLVSAETAVFRESSLGNGARQRSPGARACPGTAVTFAP